jgi:hypothetical protein
MKIDLTLNISQVLTTFDRVKRDQVPFALAKALTRTVGKAKQREQEGIRDSFDRPTRYTLNSVYSTPATKAKLEATVGIKDGLATSKGTPASKYLAPEVYGGGRRVKRFERALLAAGLMLPGYYAVVPSKGSWAAKIDAYGNIPASFVVRLLSYLQAFSEVGSKANMTRANREKLAKIKRSKKGYKTIGGVVYFVSYGPGRNQHLPAGIWAKRGTHGADVAPVILFVKDAPTYRPRFRFYGIAEQSIRNNFNRYFQESLAQAMATDRGR